MSGDQPPRPEIDNAIGDVPGADDRADAAASESLDDGALEERQLAALAKQHPSGQAPIRAEGVDLHPLVLLSVVDHFARVNTKARAARRVVGFLLGTVVPVDGKPRLDVTTSFAVPFEEDPRDASVWFLDTNFAERMWLMHRKVLPKIQVVGWYSSGPSISPNDLNIHLLVSERFCPNPIYCIVNADPSRKGLPALAYTTTESRGAKSVEFRNIATALGAVEAEEIGIEHLLRDLTDSTITTLSTKVGDRHLALSRLAQLLGSVEEYLADVIGGALPVCGDVLEALQELTNVVPLVHRLKSAEGMVVAANDQALSTFVASIARAVTALYDVIVNRRKLKRDLQARREKKEKDSKEAAEAAEKAASGDKKDGAAAGDNGDEDAPKKK